MESKRRSRLYICPYKNCTAAYTRECRLICHSRKHTGERPFVCSHEGCDKSYIRPNHLKRHEAIHSDKIYKCEFQGCGQILKTAATLKKHVDYYHKHKKRKTYKCTYCEKEFSKHCGLKVHEYSHTSVHPYVCPEEGCGKTFLVPSKLKRHSKVHQGYKCDRESCEEVLATWGLFLKHVKLAHSPVLKCKKCEEVFSSVWNLEAHEIIHSGNRTVYKCPKKNCPRFYFAVRNLTHHIKSYHNNRPFQCTSAGCYKSFKEEAHLKRHEKFHNPNVPLSSKKKRRIMPTMAHKLAGLSVDEEECYNRVFASSSSESCDNVNISHCND